MIAAPTDLVAPDECQLQSDYRDYRCRQARLLLGMTPREAVRPLHRRAIRCFGSTSDDPEDAMALLLRLCEDLLPLPPFEVWLEDVRSNPDAYLADLDRGADAPTSSTPATIEARGFERAGSPWIARLRGFRGHDAWRGFIAFEESASGTVHRTALIFREDGPTDLRERFLGFESATLEAFLRSALP